MKTGNLRNNLSRYLKRVRQSGDTIIVMDRDVPVAELRPYSGEPSGGTSSIWAMRRSFEKQSGGWEDDLVLPERSTDARKQQNPLD